MNLNIEQLVNKPVQIGELGEEEIRELILRASPILEKEPKLVNFNADKILLVGDTHGDLESTYLLYVVSSEKNMMARSFSAIMLTGV